MRHTLTSKQVRERILTAARQGRISFYERDTHTETEFDLHGEPMTIQITHGVCDSCIWDASADERRERCARQDAWVRCATVEEVERYLGPETDA